MKIGITQLVLQNMTLDDTLSLCQEAGYDAVELVFTEDRDLHPNMSETELESVRRTCEAAGVEIGSVIVNYAERGNLLSSDPGEQSRGSRCLERALEVAGALDVDGILLHPGQLTVAGTYEQAWDRLRDLLRDMAGVAARHRAAIGLENVWNKFLLSPREAREFIDEVGDPWVGIYLDTANMMAYGYPEHWIRSLGHRIKKVHIKDFSRRQHQFVNLLDGDTDWSAVMSELRSAGYRSSLIHEVGGDREALIDLGARLRRISTM